MQTQSNSTLINRKYDFYAKRLIQDALSGFYFFQDDEIENHIEKVLDRYGFYNFEYPENTRSRIRAEIMSKPEIRNKIGKIAAHMFGED